MLKDKMIIPPSFSSFAPSHNRALSRPNLSRLLPGGPHICPRVRKLLACPLWQLCGVHSFAHNCLLWDGRRGVHIRHWQVRFLWLIIRGLYKNARNSIAHHCIIFLLPGSMTTWCSWSATSPTSSGKSRGDSSAPSSCCWSSSSTLSPPSPRSSPTSPGIQTL